VTTFTGAILAALGIDWLIGYLADAIRKMDWTNNKEQISKKSRYTIIAPYLHILRASLSYIEWSLVFAICSLTILSTSMMWHPKEYRQKPETFFTGIYDSTTDTGESAPIWSVRFMEHRATAPMEVVDGKIEITEVSRNTIRHEYSVKSEKGGQVVENTLYFPGWNVYVDGSLVGVEYQNPEYRGLMTFMVPPGTHEVSIRFTETKFRRVSNIISIASLLVLVLLLAIAGIVYSYTKYTYGK